MRNETIHKKDHHIRCEHEKMLNFTIMISMHTNNMRCWYIVKPKTCQFRSTVSSFRCLHIPRMVFWIITFIHNCLISKKNKNWRTTNSDEFMMDDHHHAHSLGPLATRTVANETIIIHTKNTRMKINHSYKIFFRKNHA